MRLCMTNTVLSTGGGYDALALHGFTAWVLWFISGAKSA